MLNLYDVEDPGQRARLADLARQGQRDGWWTDYADLLPAAARHYLSLEAAATRLRCYSLQTVPDLLQIPDYTTAVCKASRPGLDRDQVSRLVAVIQRRQHSVLNGECQVHLIIDESAFLRAIAPADVMAAQVRRILDQAACPAVTIQVMAMATRQPVLSEPFTLLSFSGLVDDDLTFYGTESGKTATSRLAGASRAAADTFSTLTRAAMNPVVTAEVITRLAQQCG
jgi:hypothetical protein